LEFNLRKVAEECAELNLIILQRLNKEDDGKIPDSRIIEEIGDVLLRVGVLMLHYGEEPVAQRIESKFQKLKGWMDKEKYKYY